MYSFFSVEKKSNESKLQTDIFLFLDTVSLKEKEKVVAFILSHYQKDFPTFNNNDLINFFEGNYGTYIWDHSFKECFTKENYERLRSFEKGSWEAADFVGEYIGEYFIEKVLSSKG